MEADRPSLPGDKQPGDQGQIQGTKNHLEALFRELRSAERGRHFIQGHVRRAYHRALYATGRQHRGPCEDPRCHGASSLLKSSIAEYGEAAECYSTDSPREYVRYGSPYLTGANLDVSKHNL